MFNGEKKQIIQSKRLALCKPFTAAGFDGLDFFGMDYKTATSIVQISGYFISKLIGIKVISELKKENRLKFIILSVAVAELSLVLFGALPRPLNVFALLQRAFVGMHVGSDFQFPRGAAGDGPGGEPNGAEHCHQFGHGKVRRAVCDGASPHQ